MRRTRLAVRSVTADGLPLSLQMTTCYAPISGLVRLEEAWQVPTSYSGVGVASWLGLSPTDRGRG
jgi:hypothetical protein